MNNSLIVVVLRDAIRFIFVAALLSFVDGTLFADEQLDSVSAVERVDASTLRHKVICGYQGWFRCPGDGTRDGWMHWSRDARRVTPESLTFEMWPDMSEYGDDERYAVPDFSYPDGEPAHLFSSANAKTVERHFGWMQEHGIDGVFVQRFLVNVGNPSFDTVLANVRASAEKTGRVYGVCYDMTGTPRERIYDRLTSDWKRLVDEEKITADDRYLHHNGKPVLFVWGFFSDRFDAKIAHRIIDFFHAEGPYQVTLIGGCNWPWRTDRDAEWARAYRRLDIISPWNVGHYALADGAPVDGDPFDRKRIAATETWKADLEEARKHGRELLPVIYPGFGWTNLMGRESERHTIPRRGGEFFWEQFVAAQESGIDMVYVAMFDEVDEGTAIFKVTNSPPTQARFQTFEGLPTDWYLRLTGEGTKVIRGTKKAEKELPIEEPAVLQP